MSELDLHQKLRMEKALWAAGFYTRTNVKLASLRRTNQRNARAALDLTDVDALGIRFLEDLTPRRVAVDCKSGRSVSAIGRAFWLRGVMDHFDADRGYVVVAREIPEHQREAAARLSISLLHEQDIDTLQNRYPALSDRLRVGNLESYKYFEGNLNTITKELDRLLEYRETAFWYYSSTRAIMTAINNTRRLASKIDFKQKFHIALLLDVISLFSLAVITLSNELSRLGPSDLLDGIRSFFFGGIEGIARREQIIRGIEGVLLRISQQNSLPFDDGNVFQLDPPYLPGLAEVIIRVIGRPVEATDIPRYMKVRLMNGVLYGDWDIQELLGDQYSAVADKLAGDVIIAFLRACDIGTDMMEQFGFR